MLTKSELEYIYNLCNGSSEISDNICNTLNCTAEELSGIEPIKEGLTNSSFIFKCRNKKYIYRHPGEETDKFISRKSEAFSMKYAYELGLDKTLIKIDGEKGWKISEFIENARILDYHNKQEVKTALSMMKKLHGAKIKSEFDFDIWAKTLDFISKINSADEDAEDFDDIFKKMSRLYELVKSDNCERVLCHCDCYNPNFLIDENGGMSLIDWEYSGNDDPANDLGTFICCSDYNYEQALEILETYFGKKPEKEQLRHYLAYIAIASYYWYVWALYQRISGNDVGDYLLLWYNNTKLYMNKALEMYE